MRPKNLADLRTLLWVAIAVGLVGVQYANFERAYILPLAIFNFYFALCCGVIAHNHNHCPVFKDRRLNDTFNNVLSVFYGYPTFVWVPTHNLNHHKHVNRAGDATITWRYSRKHNALVAATYFFVSSYWQSFPINTFIAKAKAGNPRLYRKIITQYAVWLGTWAVLLVGAIYLHGWFWGAVVWGFSVGLPSLFTLWTIMFFNYEQHVHTDPWSKHNHSRNFISPFLNYMLFNNGYHGVHHEQPGLHWSKLADAHSKIADEIDPALKQRSMFVFMVRQFLLSRFWPQLGTHQVGRAPYDPPSGTIGSLDADDCDLGEAGANIGMLAGDAAPPQPSTAEPAKPAPATLPLPLENDPQRRIA
ncbi:MAG: fatty acid desaturase [Pirellulales bacterium]